ncbi:MAG: DNA-3-methyladenine glycosylase I [Planctomycetes bacterium]|nr:DNA-3-methyladenine glycosylase I [Planctomycetota bacterium]
MKKQLQRCWWCGEDPLYVAYHDREWGVPEMDDRALFEKLVLDGFQAGLSWITILRKREAFRAAFAQFDPHKIAKFGKKDVRRLLANAGIIRSRSKIESAIGNAHVWINIMKEGEGSFRDLLWQHVDHRTRQNRFRQKSDLPPATPESEAMAKCLKKVGFKFCGPTICYAFMQAVGMTNDHLVSCPRHAAVKKLARIK